MNETHDQAHIQGALTQLIIANDIYPFFDLLNASTISNITHYTLLTQESLFRRWTILEHHLLRLENLDFEALATVYKTAVSSGKSDIVAMIFEKCVVKGGEVLLVACIERRLWQCTRAFIEHYSASTDHLNLGAVVLKSLHFMMPIEHFTDLLSLSNIDVDTKNLGEALVFCGRLSFWDHFVVLWVYMDEHAIQLDEWVMEDILRWVYLRGDDFLFRMVLEVDGFTTSSISEIMISIDEALLMRYMDNSYKLINIEERNAMLSRYALEQSIEYTRL